MRRFRKFIIAGITGSVVFLLAFLIVFMTTALITYAQYGDYLDNKDKLINSTKQGLILLDRDGNPFYTFYPGKISAYVPLDNVPQHFQEALMAAEDRNFYFNLGFSPKGIVRAALANIKAGRIVQGGSTITQGLVKNVFLSPDRSIVRKFKEITLAYILTQKYTKPEILEMYINSVYFGEGAVGLEEAAQTYFGIPARQLNLSQSALLVGLLPAPSEYSPLKNRAAAEQRQILVLNQMVHEGYINRESAAQAAAFQLQLNLKEDNLNTLAHHFALYVRDQLFREYGEENVIRSGFVVKTTLDSDWQRQAEAIVFNGVNRLAKNRVSNGSAVVIHPQSGQVMVMVGSANWFDSSYGKVNMATTPRQSGSAFKPIVYAAAFEDNLITPASILDDRPQEFTRNYKPRNYDGRFRGRVTVRRALANSLNVPSVEVMQRVGVSHVLNFSQRLGITSLGSASDYGLSLVLGTGEVSLLELTHVYATFANQGLKTNLTTILEVHDKFGHLKKINGPVSQRVLSEGVTYLISSILSDTSARREVFGTALDISKTAAVKTGTTQNYRNALTVGYTPELVVGVWLGNNDNSAMDRIAGSLGPAPVWKELITQFTRQRPNLPFVPPPSVTTELVCNNLGVPAHATGSARREYFISGTESSYVCRKPSDISQLPPDLPPSSAPEPTSNPTPEPTLMAPPESPQIIVY